jgi:hypothetical protein
MSNEINFGGKTLKNTGQVALGKNGTASYYATVSGGRSNTALGQGVTISGGQYNLGTSSSYQDVIGGGSGNLLNDSYASVIGGGMTNTVSAQHTVVGGGYTNTASNNQATVSGGKFNAASGVAATVGGGRNNTASGYTSTVSGGVQNTATGLCSVIGGGGGRLIPDTIPPEGNLVGSSTGSGAVFSLVFQSNGPPTVDGPETWILSEASITDGGTGYNQYDYLTISLGAPTDVELSPASVEVSDVDPETGAILSVYVTDGGLYYRPAGTFTAFGRNHASADHSTVGGGKNNTAGGTWSDCATVSGGQDNTSLNRSFIGGGYSNTAFGGYNAIGGGNNNVSMGNWSAISGGSENTTATNTNRAAIGGGRGNVVDRTGGTVSGGYSNSALGQYAAVGGGSGNTAIGNFVPAVGAPAYATISGGKENTASGYGGVVGGGRENKAAGIYATIDGGRNNTASANYTTIGGGGVNTAAGGHDTVSGGQRNTASGSYSVIGGGRFNTVSGLYSTVSGGQRALADRRGMRAYGAGQFSTTGDAQQVDFMLRNSTTNATPTTLFLNGSSDRLTIPSGKALFATVTVAGIINGGSKAAHYSRKVAIKNVGGTTSLIGSVITLGTDVEDDAAYDVTITADNTNDALQINVTGKASETIRWVAHVQGIEIAYGS